MQSYTREELIKKFYNAENPYDPEYWGNSDYELREDYNKKMEEKNNKLNIIRQEKKELERKIEENNKKMEEMGMGTYMNHISDISIQRIREEERRNKNMFLCQCGSYILEKNKRKHWDTKKHNKWMEQNEGNIKELIEVLHENTKIALSYLD